MCGHKSLSTSCSHCLSLKNKWYKKTGLKDIEYGKEDGLLCNYMHRHKVDESAMAYYDAIWAVYHQWCKDGRSRRDCMVAELLATQDGETGTNRGISKFLKSKRLGPWSRRMVEITIKEIQRLVGQVRPSVASK